MLCRLGFSKSFPSDNHVYCDLNNSTLDFLSSFIEIVFNSEILLVVVAQLLYIKLIIKLDKTDKYKLILIVKDIMEQT